MMKKHTLCISIVILLMNTMCLAGWVDPINVPKTWPAGDLIHYDNSTPLAIAADSSMGAVVVWAEEDYIDVNIYGTLWGGSKTLIDTISAGDMNSEGMGSCGFIRIADVEITSQPVFDGTRDCFYVAVLVYDMCTLCEYNNGLGRTETWVEVYKIWNSSGTLQSASLGQFGISTEYPTLLKEWIDPLGYSKAPAGSTKIVDVAIERAFYSGIEEANLYYTYCWYESTGDPYYGVYMKQVSSSVSEIYEEILLWDEICDTGMPPTKHCLEATYDEYSGKIWLLSSRLPGNCDTGTWYASIAKLNSVGDTVVSSWINCKSNVKDCRICADNNAASYSRIAFCWRDTSDNRVKSAILTESGGVGSSFNISDSPVLYNPDITYLDSGYFAVVSKHKMYSYNTSSIRMTRFLNGAPNAKETDIIIATNGVVSGMNPTSINVFPRIATCHGTSGQIYLVWRGEVLPSDRKLICKRTSSIPFRLGMYYSTYGKMLFPPDPDWVLWKKEPSYLDPNNFYGSANRECVVDVTTTYFGVGNQVYDSYFQVYLDDNYLDENVAKLRLLEDSSDPDSGTPLPDLADSSDGEGWTEMIDTSNVLHYWERRPGGHDCFHVRIPDEGSVDNEWIKILLERYKRPRLYLYYIDWEP